MLEFRLLSVSCRNYNTTTGVMCRSGRCSRGQCVSAIRKPLLSACRDMAGIGYVRYPIRDVHLFLREPLDARSGGIDRCFGMLTLSRQGRLRHSQPLCSATEMLLFANRHELPQMSQFHTDTSARLIR